MLVTSFSQERFNLFKPIDFLYMCQKAGRRGMASDTASPARTTRPLSGTGVRHEAFPPASRLSDSHLMETILGLTRVHGSEDDIFIGTHELDTEPITLLLSAPRMAR